MDSNNKKKNNIKELWSNRRFRAILFFGFYFVFFAILILLANSVGDKNNNTDKNQINSEAQDKWEVLTNNYEYLYNINIKANDITNNIILQGKRYQNKNLFSKIINDNETSYAYTFYNNVYLKTDNDYLKTDNFIFVYSDFDNNLIDLNYIKEIVSKATLKSKVTNFDESIEEKYYYNDDRELYIDVTYKDNLITKIVITGTNLDINLQYKNINKVQDFIVETKDN